MSIRLQRLSRSLERQPVWLSMTLALGAVITVVAIVAGSKLNLADLLAATPLLACARCNGRLTALAAVCAIALSAIVGIVYGGPTTGSVAYRFAIVGGAGIFAILAAVMRGRREDTLIRISERVQRAILRPLPSELGGVAFASHYQSASPQALVGGDLYDVTMTPFGPRLIIGDVKGKGLDAVGQCAAVLAIFREMAPAEPDLVRLAEAMDARFARDIAEAVGMSEAERELAHTAGLLHDIGRFALSDRVAERGRTLTEEDWMAIQRHPELGADMLRDLGMYGPVAEIVLAHHERIDGRGYPSGLSEEEIPEIAKIISVAEVYDTLTASDTYRTRMSSFEALTELRRVAGDVGLPVVGAGTPAQHGRARHGPPEPARGQRQDAGHQPASRIAWVEPLGTFHHGAAIGAVAAHRLDPARQRQGHGGIWIHQQRTAEQVSRSFPPGVRHVPDGEGRHP